MAYQVPERRRKEGKPRMKRWCGEEFEELGCG
jgi:hypothetical protein